MLCKTHNRRTENHAALVQCIKLNVPEVERKKTETRLWHENLFSFHSNLLKTQKQEDAITTHKQRTNKRNDNIHFKDKCHLSLSNSNCKIFSKNCTGLIPSGKKTYYGVLNNNSHDENCLKECLCTEKVTFNYHKFEFFYLFAQKYFYFLVFPLGLIILKHNRNLNLTLNRELHSSKETIPNITWGLFRGWREEKWGSFWGLYSCSSRSQYFPIRTCV